MVRLEANVVARRRRCRVTCRLHDRLGERRLHRRRRLEPTLRLRGQERLDDVDELFGQPDVRRSQRHPLARRVRLSDFGERPASHGIVARYEEIEQYPTL